MTGITHTVAGRIYSVILAPVTAYVVMQVADVFLEAFVPRREAESLRVGHEVIASPTQDGVKFRPIDFRPLLPQENGTAS
jgi:hypothetical protein